MSSSMSLTAHISWNEPAVSPPGECLPSTIGNARLVALSNATTSASPDTPGDSSVVRRSERMDIAEQSTVSAGRLKGPELCLRLQRGCGVRAWGPDGLGTGGGERARGRGGRWCRLRAVPAAPVGLRRGGLRRAGLGA